MKEIIFSIIGITILIASIDYIYILKNCEI